MTIIVWANSYIKILENWYHRGSLPPNREEKFGIAFVVGIGENRR